MKQVGLLDYGSGNLRSAQRALARVGADVTVTADYDEAMAADGLLVNLPKTQPIVSVGVNLGALPTKGLTLPLISYGGSSMALTCAMAGVLLRATFEINRSLDARELRKRMSAAVAATDVNIAAHPDHTKETRHEPR